MGASLCCVNLQSFGHMPRGSMAGLCGSSIFVFGGTFTLIFIVAIIRFMFLPAMTNDSFPTSYPAFVTIFSPRPLFLRQGFSVITLEPVLDHSVN